MNDIVIMNSKNKKYRVLFLLSNPGVGGTETFVLSLIPLLAKKGVDASILNLWKDSDIRQIANNIDIPYYELEGDSRRSNIKKTVQLVSFINEGEYDLIYLFGLRVNIILRLLTPFLKNKILISGVRGEDDWRKWYHVLADRYTQHKISMTVCNCKKLLSLKRNREKTPLDKLLVIANGIDIHYFSKDYKLWPNKTELNLPEAHTFITVAGLREVKGHEFLLESIAKAKNKGLSSSVNFLWIGSGPLKEKLEEKIEKLSLDDSVKMIGSFGDVRPYLANSEAFILPSRGEGMPRAMMEAMSMELPVLCTDVGGVTEIVENGREGLVVPYGDVDAMSDSLIQLSEEWLNGDRGSLARQTIVEKFSLDKMVNEHLILFNNIIRRKKG